MSGMVSLVGAGPGDPELLTVKAVLRLEQADVVFHDALVASKVLHLARRARLVDVGKRAGRRAVSQGAIHRLLIDRACLGERVVRLKGGDPFVFGRGGEEALALSAAGVPFEVIPGISSALGVPALSGIPVTHRGVTSAFLVVSGHSRQAYAPVLDTLRPHSATVVVLMGLAHRADIAAFLIARGWRSGTPAATLLRGSTPEASEEIATLTDWSQQSFVGTGPGTLIIGEVVSLPRWLPQFHVPFAVAEKGVNV